MDLGVKNRVALICGSTSGMGRAVARALALEGARVVVNGRTPARTEEAARALAAETGGSIVGFGADVTAADAAEQLVNRVHHELGRLDILFCNAGGPPAAPFKDHSRQAWQDALELNLLSTISLCRAAVPMMRKSQWGRILCLTSIAAKQPLPGLILSSTARAGVHGFAKALADEVAPDRITVNIICPGYIMTDRIEEVTQSRAARERRTSQEVMKQIVQDIPLGRMGLPDEVGAAAAFLASERASYITGAVLQVDGGFTRAID